MKRTILSLKMVTFFLLLIPTSFTINSYCQTETEELSILNEWIEWSDGKNMLVHHLNKQAFAYLDKRDMEVTQLNTAEEWTARQRKVKKILMKLVGPFPEKTPLNARITGIVKKDGYRVEKVIYESVPGFLVTACLFIPDGIKGKERRPVIIQVSGHGFQAFRSQGTIRQILNLVSRGFIVFAIDPVGQGERIQYWDAEKKTSRLGASPVSEHSYFGNQMLLSGISPIRYFTWDGIRGVDYLVSRKEVDPERIGIFGCSGGGTQTTFISALDDRIKAAAPGCYITGYRRLLESIGPQDAEQNIYQGIKYGITHADLLELRAPKPLLISSTSRDYFSIQGAMESFAEIKMAYMAFGKEENAGQVIDDAGHGFAGNINAIYSFFERVLERPVYTKEVKYDALKPDELQVTPTGQIMTSYGGETAFTVGLRTAQALVNKLMESRKDPGTHLSKISTGAQEISGYIAPRPETESVFRGRYQREGYAVEMYALHGEGNYVIPLLLFVPANAVKCPSVIYIHPKGKATDAAVGGRIEQLTRSGFIVAAPDLIGTGEVAPDSRDGTDYIPNYVALLTGRSIPGLQAGDIIRVVNFLKMRSDSDLNKIGAIAHDEMCPALLHAAAFDRSINPVILSGAPVSYRSIAMNRDYEVRLSEEVVQAVNASNEVNYSNSTVAGALTGYDLPDLIGCIAPGKIALIDIKDQMKKTAPGKVVDEEMQFPRAVYELKKSPDNLRILPSSADILSVIKWGFD